MDLTEVQQERYARHLLLDGWGGDGQERLLQARVRVVGEGPAALWAARYLAASGVAALVVDPRVADDVRGLNPDARVEAHGPADLEVHPRGAAIDGARAALQAVAALVRGAP
jgi:adenylyltransferase/sulfurtransferase